MCINITTFTKEVSKGKVITDDERLKLDLSCNSKLNLFGAKLLECVIFCHTIYRRHLSIKFHAMDFWTLNCMSIDHGSSLFFVRGDRCIILYQNQRRSEGGATGANVPGAKILGAPKS